MFVFKQSFKKQFPTFPIGEISSYLRTMEKSISTAINLVQPPWWPLTKGQIVLLGKQVTHFSFFMSHFMTKRHASMRKKRE